MKDKKTGTKILINNISTEEKSFLFLYLLFSNLILRQHQMSDSLSITELLCADSDRFQHCTGFTDQLQTIVVTQLFKNF